MKRALAAPRVASADGAYLLAVQSLDTLIGVF
jgi:hypothetical protein